MKPLSEIVLGIDVFVSYAGNETSSLRVPADIEVFMARCQVPDDGKQVMPSILLQEEQDVLVGELDEWEALSLVVLREVSLCLNLGLIDCLPRFLLLF